MLFSSDFWNTDSALIHLKEAINWRKISETVPANIPNVRKTIRDEMRYEAKKAVAAARKYHAKRFA